MGDAVGSAAGAGRGALDYVILMAPRVVGVIATIVIGLIASRLARRATVWLVQRTGLDALAEKVGISRMLYAVGIKRSLPQVLGQVVYYVGLMLTGSSLAEMLGLPFLAAGIAFVTAYIPKVFAAALILVGAMVLADLLRSVVGRVASRRKDVESPDFIGQAVYYLVMIIAGTIAADTLGFQTELINALIQIAIAAAAFGLALAFALGARGTFSHLVARYYAERMYRRGDRIHIDGRTGIVIGYGATQIILETPDGEYVVPCQRLIDDVVRLERVEKVRAEAELARQEAAVEATPPVEPEG